MAKKTGKALKRLTKAVNRLEKQNEHLTEMLEKTREDQAVAHRELRNLLEEHITTHDAAPDEQTEIHSLDDGGEEGPEVTEAAERRAKELGVDLSGVKGAGSGGRILVKDVEAAADGER